MLLWMSRAERPVEGVGGPPCPCTTSCASAQRRAERPKLRSESSSEVLQRHIHFFKRLSCLDSPAKEAVTLLWHQTTNSTLTTRLKIVSTLKTILTFEDLPLELRSIILKLWLEDLLTRHSMSGSLRWDNDALRQRRADCLSHSAFKALWATTMSHRTAAILELRNLADALPTRSWSNYEPRRIIRGHSANLREKDG